MANASLLEILQTIISLITGGITGIATGIGQGLSTLVQSLFFSSGETGGLSVFAGVVFIFVGISLAMSLCRWVVNFITSLGARNR